MINLQELRIGNWVIIDLFGGLFPFEYHQITAKDIYELSLSENEQYLKMCKPIELTEKIILNFGFKVEDSFLGTVKISMNDFDMFIKNDISDSRMKFVHQLQNRFYSITGIELNDITAYNYYLTKTPYNEKDSLRMDFNEFLLAEKGHNTTWDENYKFGQLPLNLF